MSDMDDGFEDAGQAPEEAQEQRPPCCPEEEALNQVGVRMHFVENWVGEPPNRHPVIDPSFVRNVLLPFKPDEWWDLTTRDGRNYIGPCCGTTGAMQDILNSVYRNGGWIDSHELLELGGMAESHQDGFEDWDKPLVGDDLIGALASWQKTDPWSRIGVIYRVLQGKINPPRDYKPELRKEDKPEEKAIWVLRNGLTYLSYRDLFERPEEDKATNHANRLLLLARVLPAMKTLLGTLQGYKPFDGFALVPKAQPDTVLNNRMGSCVYATTAAAQKVLDISKRGAVEDGEPDAEADPILIRPVRVSIEDGLKFTDIS